jgi:hypothetical protein
MMQDDLALTLRAAEGLLSGAFNRAVRLAEAVRLSEPGRRNLLVRVRDLADSNAASFIIKKVMVDNFDPTDVSSWDTMRFFRDWSGAEFLTGALATSRTPRFYAGHYSTGCLVLEDLGNPGSLDQTLLHEHLPEAATALVKFAACLGSVHAATLGKHDEFESLLHGISPHLSTLSRVGNQLRKVINGLLATLESIGVRPGKGFAEEIESVNITVESPGPFFSYIHGDPCPDNVLWDGNEVRLVDFEFGGFGHALIDATYGRMMFPTCWCANRLPVTVVSNMETAYRSELAKTCPAADDDQIFRTALARSCAYWLFTTVGGQLRRALNEDQDWGIATVRQRILARLEAFIATTETCDELPALRALASHLGRVLQKRWSETPPLPLYPVFRSDPEP